MTSPGTADETVDKLGMTDEQWEWFQKATRGYGDQDENGIDLSLLRENLRLTPTQRLDNLQSALNFFHMVKRGRATTATENHQSS